MTAKAIVLLGLVHEARVLIDKYVLEIDRLENELQVTRKSEMALNSEVTRLQALIKSSRQKDCNCAFCKDAKFALGEI